MKPKSGGNGGDAGGIVYKPASESLIRQLVPLLFYITLTLDTNNNEVWSGQRKIVYKPYSLASILDPSVAKVSYTREIYDTSFVLWNLISARAIHSR